MNNSTQYTVSVNKVLEYKPFCLKGVGYLAKMYNWYGTCNPSQKTIAQKMGVGLTTTKQALKQFRQDGLMSIVGRYKLTSLYHPGPLLCDIKYRDQLSSVIPELKGFPVFKLMSAGILTTNIYIQSHVKFVDVPRRSEFWDEFWFYHHKNQEKTAIALPMAEKRLEKKGEEVMQPSVLIPDFVENITEVQLTWDDKLELAAFSAAIIDLARRRVTSSGTLTNPTAYFKAICRKEHQARLQGPTRSPSFSQKATKQPSVKRQRPSEQEYAYARYNHLEYLHSVTTDPEAKQRLFKQLQKQAEKLTVTPEPVLGIAESWQKSTEELSTMKAAGLANVKDAGMRQYLSILFDASVKQYNKTTEPIQDRLQEVIKNSNIALDEDKRFIARPQLLETDLEVDESEYDSINTHNLFGG